MLVWRLSLLLALVPKLALAWGSSSSGGTDYTNYADSFSRDWLSDGSSISIKLEGCVWGYVYDSEEAGCLEDSSEDGTTSWYQMSNCRRAQAAFSLYASSSAGNCNSGNYKETFVTTVGVAEFTGWLQEWDANSPFNSDDDGNNDDGYGGWDIDELPLCEEGDNGYVGLGCNDDGTFAISYFEDQYCLSSTGVYDSLDNLNYQLKSYQTCAALTIDSGDDDDDGGGGDSGDGGADGSLASNLVYYAQSCSNIDSGLCSDDAAMESRRSTAGKSGRGYHSSSSGASKSWTTKVKYVLGGLLLVASLIMFTGILFTNRRRRKALMQRKFRQSSRGGKSSRSKSSRSKSRDGRSRGSSRRSKSRPRSAAESAKRKAEKEAAEEQDTGVFT
eukprot:CAMPEP_0119013104 /NCGR_PEP_ID=MMETSP1176-20130426/7915_1 /TAXON_ID=265551 /ORGANISM="Synedropsis recta cf, Strain CCMP1620" /LENGTH=386 /DNA_ID=CAMNT_0006966159 /DNA_START=270 /DNA_END=1430 /DNA_ORIENTATION=+